MSEKTLWELLWDYDPNGLIVFDEDFTIQIVNNAFCAMFKVQPEQVIGQHVSVLFEDYSNLQRVKDQNVTIKGFEREYPRHGLYLRHVIFPVKDQGIIACIMVDLTSEHQRQEEMNHMKHELISQVNKVIDKQMSIAQEIASLLGETTAEAKVSLLKIRNMLNEEIK
jgi:PAS domain S-box-containing protein